MIHITKNGITILTIEEIKVIHVGQYKPYGDSFYEYDIITSEKDVEKIRKYCIEKYNYNKELPTEEEFRNNKHRFIDASYYFNGYYSLTPIEGGYKFIMCKPYTD